MDKSLETTRQQINKTLRRVLLVAVNKDMPTRVRDEAGYTALWLLRSFRHVMNEASLELVEYEAMRTRDAPTTIGKHALSLEILPVLGCCVLIDDIYYDFLEEILYSLAYNNSGSRMHGLKTFSFLADECGIGDVDDVVTHCLGKGFLDTDLHLRLAICTKTDSDYKILVFDRWNMMYPNSINEPFTDMLGNRGCEIDNQFFSNFHKGIEALAFHQLLCDFTETENEKSQPQSKLDYVEVLSSEMSSQFVNAAIRQKTITLR